MSFRSHGTEKVDLGQAADTMKRMDPMNPTDPMNPIDPMNPMDPMEPRRTVAEPSAPAEMAPEPESAPKQAKPAGNKRTAPARLAAVSASMLPLRPAAFRTAQARHLLLRAGFGGTPAQLKVLVDWGITKSVDHLLNFEAVPFEGVDASEFDKDIIRPANDEERGELAKARRNNDEAAVARLRAERQEAQRKDREQVRWMQRWWLKRMIETPRPLEEKMTLFWHGHFATSYRTIEDSYHMFMQNQLFRTHAVGNFGKLLYGIVRDPAMIAYLDNNDSRKGRPNENLARELMELFSLGVGNYTETDIKEGARALTGYTFTDDEFTFQKRNHDTGIKRILGSRGALDGDGFVAEILRQPACATFIATKLYRYFVSDYPTGRREIDQAGARVVADLASTLRAENYEIKPVLRKLFLSEHFYQPALIGEQIKSPAELVVGTVRQLGTPPRDLALLADSMNMMGQNLMFPPSVKGWTGGRSWINTATMFIRQNIACFLLTGRTPSGFDALAQVEQFDPSALMQALTGDRSPSDVNEVIDEVLRFMLGRVSTHNQQTLRAFVDERGGQLTPDVQARALLLVSAMPEYQLC
jgi:uncharacterized protein (DUF1800 family)